MQRDKKKKQYPIVNKYRPLLFWRECRFCGKEFKKESGFIISDIKICRASNEDPIEISYCCSKCGNNVESVKRKVEIEKCSRNIINVKPPAPGTKDNRRLDRIFKSELYEDSRSDNFK
ncbi:hypothetical protein [Clostridium butyricum]